MGYVINSLTGENTELKVPHVIAGSTGNGQFILLFTWGFNGWTLYNCGEQTVEVGEYTLSFGQSCHIHQHDCIVVQGQNQQWTVNCADAPEPALYQRFDASSVLVPGLMLALPNSDDPKIILYRSPMGHWVCEGPFGICRLEHQCNIGDGSSHLPVWEKSEDTAGNDLQVLFTVSQNEENVALQLNLGFSYLDLGQRNHHYLLLLLARKRIADKEQGISMSERGWLDKEQLCDMMGLTENHLNILIFRLRKQVEALSEARVDMVQLIQRRTGELRFGCEGIKIVGGMQQRQPA